MRAAIAGGNLAAAAGLGFRRQVRRWTIIALAGFAAGLCAARIQAEEVIQAALQIAEPAPRLVVAPCCPKCGQLPENCPHTPTPAAPDRSGGAIPEWGRQGQPGQSQGGQQQPQGQGQPGQQGQQGQQAQQGQQGQQGQTPGASDSNALASSIGAASSAQSAAPFMIGDLFGTGSSVLSLPSMVVQGTPFTVGFQNVPPGGSPLVSVPIQLPGSPTGTASFVTTDNAPFFPPRTHDSIANLAALNAQFHQAQLNGTVNNFMVGLQENPLFTQDVAAYLHSLYPNGAALPTGQTASGGGSAAFRNGTGTFDPNNSPPTSQSSPRDLTTTPTPDQFFLAWQYQYTPNVLSQPVLINIPSPSSSGGAVVGFTKISENTSPLPRDRVFFNFSYFNNVPLLATGNNVFRYSPGFEKTFIDGLTSIEMRFPFAGTLDPTIVADGTTRTDKVVFGNMSIAFKGLLLRYDDFALSMGLQVTAPTAPDLFVGFSDGTQLLRVRNDSVHMMPFVGALFTPNDRFFAQGFFQVDTVTTGNRTLANLNFAGLQDVGRLQDPAFAYLDIGIGSWVYRDRTRSARLTAFAPTLELHYNKSLQATDVIQASNFTIGNFASNIEIFNLTAGGFFQFGPNDTLTLGMTTPLGSGTDRQFNGELRVFFNHRFGPQSRASQVSF